MSSLTTTLPFSPATHRRATRPARPYKPAGLVNRSRPGALLPVARFRFDGTRDFFAEMWTPGLLERLQEPLTRHRE
jgi:hypothetical protein